MKKTLTTLFVFATLLVVVLSFTVLADAEERTGAVFAADEFYRSSEALTEIPHTFEAWVKVSKDAAASELGVIVGNYKDASTHSYGMEVRKNGNPYLWLGYGATGTRGNFDKVDLRTGEWTHVAITYNATNAYCYINGELEQTLTLNCKDVDMSKTGVVCLGGDLRSKNARWLKSSELSTVAVFSDMRTEEEIKADMKNVDLSDANLQVSYDLSPEDDSRLTDASPNGNDLAYSGTLWVSTSGGDDSEPVEGGMTFNTDPYKLAKIIDKPIYTWEATVCFPKNMLMSERGGVMIGNYNVTLPCVNFEIYSNGSPRVYITNEAGKVFNYVFDKVNVYNGKWTHIAIVKEADDQLSCYINGELKQTITKAIPDVITTDVHVLGGDQRSGNGQFFRGRLKNVALYSDARTADEIKADMTAIGTEDLICGFDLDGLDNPDVIADKSQNGYDAKIKRAYFTEKTPVEDYAYSFAVIGDTQILAQYYPEKFTALYDWVLGNVESKNIQYVIGLGDITNSSADAEFALAKNNILRMNGVVPYSLVRGNHDTVSQMNKYFPMSEFGSTVTGTYSDSSILNSYHIFTVGEVQYLLFTLDYGASDAVLNWAAGIIEAHPEHNVIITTHAYLYRDGTTLDAGDVCPPATSGGYNNGDHMWDKLIKKYENIVLVLSGHDPCDKIICTQTEGDNGNIVTQMLIDPQGVDNAQGGIGLAAMFYFSEDGKTLQVEYYSTAKNAYFMEENQFTVTLDMVEKHTHTLDENGVCTGCGAQVEEPKDPDDSDKPAPPTGESTYVSIVVVVIAMIGMCLVYKKNKKTF